jgi:hypothetical protein
MVQRRQKFIFSLSFVEHGLGLVLLVLFLNFFGIIGLPLAESVAIFLASALKYTYLVRTGFISPFKFSKLFTFGVSDKEIFLSGWNHLSGHLRTFFART